MKDMLIGWLVNYMRDGKRISIVLVALLNYVAVYLRGKGIEVPDETVTSLASFAAVAVLAAWSKYEAQKKAVAPPTP